MSKEVEEVQEADWEEYAAWEEHLAWLQAHPEPDPPCPLTDDTCPVCIAHVQEQQDIPF